MHPRHSTPPYNTPSYNTPSYNTPYLLRHHLVQRRHDKPSRKVRQLPTKVYGVSWREFPSHFLHVNVVGEELLVVGEVGGVFGGRGGVHILDIRASSDHLVNFFIQRLLNARLGQIRRSIDTTPPA